MNWDLIVAIGLGVGAIALIYWVGFMDGEEVGYDLGQRDAGIRARDLVENELTGKDRL